MAKNWKLRTLAAFLVALVSLPLVYSCSSTPTEPNVPSATEPLAIPTTVRPSETPKPTATISIPDPPYLTRLDPKLPKPVSYTHLRAHET